MDNFPVRKPDFTSSKIWDMFRSHRKTRINKYIPRVKSIAPNPLDAILNKTKNDHTIRTRAIGRTNCF